MKKVLFLIDSLRGGGAEKVLVNLVNNIDCSEYDITVETMFFNGVNAKDLKPEIKLESKNAPFFKGISHVLRIIPDKLLYKYFIGDKKYDVLVAYMHGASAKVISGCTCTDVKKFAWIHTAEMEHGSIWKFYKTKEQTIESYARFDKIVAVSEEVKKAFCEKTGLDEKVIVRYNTNDVEKIKKLADEGFEFDKKCFHICTMGRLSEEKGFDRLIRIASGLKNAGLIFDVHIFGIGQEQENLEKLISEYSVNDTVYLDGYTDNPYKVLSHSDLFVCSSLAEGLSTAMSEAVILGIPVVSTDVAGAKEVLGENNEYSIVTDNDENSLYEAIKIMLTDKTVYEEYKNKVALRAGFFDTKKTVKEITDLF